MAQPAGCNNVEDVVLAVFASTVGACDLNRDGVVSAADLTATFSSGAAPSPTQPPTATATPSGSPNASPTSTATATPSQPVGTRTPTPALCPTAGVDLIIDIDNRTGRTPISVQLTGGRLEGACRPGALATAYNKTVTCANTQSLTCTEVTSLAPGSWRHSLHVATPGTGQLQHQTSLVVAGTSLNRIRFTAFASVRSIQTTANAGSGSLRNALQTADSSAKPLLIQFDPTVFPSGVPTTIQLAFQLPVLAASDVTIDGTDSSGAVGNRVIDAGGLPISALAISGARNHLVGLTLRNSGGNDRDVLNISGPQADANLVERVLIDGPGTADGIGVDGNAGKDFDDSVNIIRDCEIRGVADKGVKVTTGAYARVEQSWTHDNANGGLQATLGGHLQAWHNLVERNRGSTAQNGLSVNALDDMAGPGSFSELDSWGNISRANGANGISVRAFSFAHVRDDYLATNGSSGLRVFNDVGPAATVVVEGTSAVCNAVDGAVVANTSVADFGGGLLGSAGNNAFTQNNLPAGGANLRNATTLQTSAINNQWEHCGHDVTCDDAAIAAFDLADHGANTPFAPAQAHRMQKSPVLTGVTPTKGKQGELLRIFGSGFNVIDGHFAEDQCADVNGRNRCVPLRGNCVQINGVSAPVEAVTPTMLVVRWPFTCVQPVPLIVKVDQGATGTTSAPLTVCTNEALEP